MAAARKVYHVMVTMRTFVDVRTVSAERAKTIAEREIGERIDIGYYDLTSQIVPADQVTNHPERFG